MKNPAPCMVHSDIFRNKILLFISRDEKSGGFIGPLRYSSKQKTNSFLHSGERGTENQLYPQNAVQPFHMTIRRMYIYMTCFYKDGVYCVTIRL